MRKRLLPPLLVLAFPCFSFADLYSERIQPLLKQRCYACHGALKQKAGLRLDTVASMTKGGDDGPVVVAGSPETSELLRRITAKKKDEVMPPEGSPLKDEEVGWIREWIAQGAVAPAKDTPEADPRAHWSFQPRKAAPPPTPESGWARTPVDAFLERGRRQRGLRPAGEASARVSLRRLRLDLTGLPPSADEQRAFLADEHANRFERAADRLLASPAYGERWGRHWMDVWRYSDWYGRRNVPDVLNSYGQIWRWRDWIVRSLNEGKGYDRMVTEMLAADELAPGDQANVVATGFLARNFYRWNYNLWMKDCVEHTAKAFLGLTMNCCHCHDHKYDPITHEEYFRFRAFFEPMEIRHDRWPGEADPGPYPKYSYGAAYAPITSGLVRVMDEKLDAETRMYSGGESRNIIAGRPPVTPGAPAFLGGDKLKIEPVPLPTESWMPALREFVRREEIAKAEGAVKSAAEALEQARAGQSKLTLELAEARHRQALAERRSLLARLAAEEARAAGAESSELSNAAGKAEREAALAKAAAKLLEAQQAVAEAEGDAKRGDALTKARRQLETATAEASKAKEALAKESADYTPPGPRYPKQSTGRRSALAKWMVDPANPLPARVAANHLWRWHMGQALVSTTDNFGRNGQPPTHPELLDWLANRLVENHWAMKPLHREIVTSAAYRMAGNSDPANAKVDPDNRFFWRFPSRRMEAEELRDAMLAMAYELDLAVGGREIEQKDWATAKRRSLYLSHHGEGKTEFLDIFDGANALECYQRRTSVRPQQALALTNSQVARDLGAKFAARLDGDDPSFVALAFETALSRPPTDAEHEASMDFLLTQRQASDAARARAGLAQALFSHHEFLTVR